MTDNQTDRHRDNKSICIEKQMDKKNIDKKTYKQWKDGETDRGRDQPTDRNKERRTDRQTDKKDRQNE